MLKTEEKGSKIKIKEKNSLKNKTREGYSIDNIFLLLSTIFLLIEHFFVEHKPGIVQKTDYILTDKLPYNQRENRHNSVKCNKNKDKGVQCEVNNVTYT